MSDSTEAKQNIGDQAELEEVRTHKSLSYWQLMKIRFLRNRLARIGLAVLSVLYVLVFFCEFFAPYDQDYALRGKEAHPPQRIRFVDEEGKFHLRPFLYNYKRYTNPDTKQILYEEDRSVKYPIHFLVRTGEPYKLFGFLPIQSRWHLFGVKEGYLFVLGTDKYARDLFSRIFFGGRISMTIGWVGVAISIIIGVLLGVASGYFGGIVDNIIQRIIEVLISIPGIPLWMALSAVLPKEWNPIQVYFGITVILSILGWTSLARILRGMVLALREAQFVMAAENLGASHMRLIIRHLAPSSISYIIVHTTLAVPSMILGETALSFLGLGIRPPMTSWGVLLSETQSVNRLINHQWYIIPVFFVVATVLCFNFMGDGMRDAADPYSAR